MVKINSSTTIKPLVSVVMATYNGEKYILEQLDSIIAQSYRPMEIVIIDDGSCDTSCDVIREYIQNYRQENIHFYPNVKNIGIVKTFEQGINHATGAFVAFCDQDDIWLPNKIACLVDNIGTNWLIHSDAKLIDGNGKIINESYTRQCKRTNKITFSDYLFSNNVTGCTAMITRELINIALPIPDGFYIHDHYFAIIAAYFNKITYSNKALVLYRQHGFNNIGAKRPRSYTKFITTHKDAADSYNLLLKFCTCFKDNYELKIIIDYRKSVYLGKWTSTYSIFNLRKFNLGYKYIFDFYLLIGFGNRFIAKFIYSLFLLKEQWVNK